MSEKDAATHWLDEYPGAEFLCSCHDEAVRVLYDPDDDEFYLSTWRGWKGSVLWRERLRHIWRIVRTGDPWDDISLDAETARRLAVYICAKGPGATFAGTSLTQTSGGVHTFTAEVKS